MDEYHPDERDSDSPDVKSEPESGKNLKYWIFNIPNKKKIEFVFFLFILSLTGSLIIDETTPRVDIGKKGLRFLEHLSFHLLHSFTPNRVKNKLMLLGDISRSNLWYKDNLNGGWKNNGFNSRPQSSGWNR